MVYSQDISGCLEARIGDAGLSETDLAARVATLEAAQAGLRDQYENRSLPILRLPETEDDLAPLKALADFLGDGATDVVLLGTGGSSLGAQALVQLAGYGVPGQGLGAHFGGTGPSLHFFDNLDGHTMAGAFARLPLETTKFLIVSKSGGTAETMMQGLTAIQALKDAGRSDRLAAQVAAITSPGAGPLRALAESIGAPILDHHPQVGGRFSVLSNVGLVPAHLAGLDVSALRGGAKTVIDSLLNDGAGDHLPAVGAAVNIALNEEKGISQTVLMPYTDRLQLFAFWYRQLWAESLGKDGKGTTPINALGPVDQHSQVQLYLSGPADKLYTVVMTACAGEGPRVPADLVSDPKLVYLSDKTIGDLQDAEQRATADTLINNNRPTRLITCETLTEEVLGALLMHYMLETVFAAALLGVDPYDQPAVEEGKILARKYLGEL